MTKSVFTDYARLVKFEHTLFAMPFALMGFFLGLKQENSSLNGKLLLMVVLCMVFARNSAMGFNRYLDRRIDSRNPRTARREIPAGVINPTSALIFVIVNVILFVATTWFINRLCFYLSPVALFVILFYSYTKRITPLCHFVLSLGLAIAPVGAYLAVAGQFDTVPIVISTIVFFWVSGFDIIYALQDEEFDREWNLMSIPALIGKKNALRFSLIIHFFSAILVIITALMVEDNWLIWTGSVIFIVLLFYQHLLVKSNDLSRVNLAFFTTNGIASLIYGAFFIAGLILK